MEVIYGTDIVISEARHPMQLLLGMYQHKNL